MWYGETGGTRDVAQSTTGRGRPSAMAAKDRAQPGDSGPGAGRSCRAAPTLVVLDGRRKRRGSGAPGEGLKEQNQWARGTHD